MTGDCFRELREASDNDATFIARARNDLPALLAAHDAALTRIAELEAQLAGALDHSAGNMLDGASRVAELEAENARLREALLFIAFDPRMPKWTDVFADPVHIAYVALGGRYRHGNRIDDESALTGKATT